MAPRQEKSALKRARGSAGEDTEAKKPRRSARFSNAVEANGESLKQNVGLPSPVTNKISTDTDSTNGARRATASPRSNGGRKDDPQQRATPVSSPPPSSLNRNGLSSPPQDTQPFSQFLPPPPFSYEVEDEDAEGVWGYLVPLDGVATSEALVLKKRAACPVPEKSKGEADGKKKVSKKHYEEAEEEYEEKKATSGVPAGGYLLGRHVECDRQINNPTVSNRHCIIFSENKNTETIAVLEDLSGNGTYVNDAIIGRNKRRELHDGDEISLVGAARFSFRYPQQRETNNGFRQQYTVQGQLGKGHFATVYLAVEKTSGMQYAVKKFEKRSGPGERSKIEGLQQEIAVLMSVSHPNMLCLKDTFNESDGVYLVLELAPEGELFNWIVMKQKLSEDDTRRIFIQLFQGLKYLHDRNIVHRDIKPENILLVDKDLTIKVADFGLAKIIGEESFTTTLCGTPSYVAPEILEQSNRRRYTRAVDIWSLGVVLYICLCGFPPFSDELYTKNNPYTLSDQIKQGRFDYPSPYWDSVGDPALDLIDRMLTVKVEDRITVDECLEHPWTTNQRAASVTDSTDGLTGALAGLDFSKRKPQRERTLLSSINDVKIERVINTQSDAPPVKVFDKNPGVKAQKKVLPGGKVETKIIKEDGKKGGGKAENTVEPSPDAARDVSEFVEMGGKGDQVLFDDNNVSMYPDETVKAGAEKEEK